MSVKSLQVKFFYTYFTVAGNLLAGVVWGWTWPDH